MPNIPITEENIPSKPTEEDKMPSETVFISENLKVNENGSISVSTPTKEWENELISIAELIVIDYANFSGRESANRSAFREAVKKHLRPFISQQKALSYEEGKLNKAPMGVSQWMNYGEKWNYAQFWKKKIEAEAYEEGRNKAVDDAFYVGFIKGRED